MTTPNEYKQIGDWSDPQLSSFGINFKPESTSCLALKNVWVYFRVGDYVSKEDVTRSMAKIEDD